MQEDWRLYNKKADFRAIAQRLNIPEPMAVILCNRGLTSLDQCRKYLYGTMEDLYDPFLMRGMKEGIELIADTLKREEKILVIGDFDTDGICAAYILETFLRSAGAKVSVRIPNRVAEGYGFNTAMAEDAALDGVSLLITCDNGISALDAVNRAKELGMCVIVTDHHEPMETLPRADAVIDPKQKECAYPFKELCGAGITYKCMQALNRFLGLGKETLLEELLQFAAIATIADIVPLVDENRILASEGIKVLRRIPNPGLAALVKACNVDISTINSGNISFQVAPCLNSTGRLKSADMALDLFRTRDIREADLRAVEIARLNEERKEMTARLMNEAVREMEEREEAGLEKILVVYLPGAHESLAGLIAGRLMEKYYRPALVVTDSSGVLKGSARSTPSFDIISAIREHGQLFEKSGGHKRSCGFTLKQNGTPQETVDHLSRALLGTCHLTGEDLKRKVWIDLPLSLKYMNPEFIDMLELLEPFGAENEKPLFGVSHARISYPAVYGRKSNALRMLITDSDGYEANGIMFGNETYLRGLCEQLERSKMATVLFHLSMNEYGGRRQPQLLIQKLRVIESTPDGHN